MPVRAEQSLPAPGLQSQLPDPHRPWGSTCGKAPPGGTELCSAQGEGSVGPKRGAGPRGSVSVPRSLSGTRSAFPLCSFQRGEPPGSTPVPSHPHSCLLPGNWPRTWGVAETMGSNHTLRAQDPGHPGASKDASSRVKRACSYRRHFSSRTKHFLGEATQGLKREGRWGPTPTFCPSWAAVL